MVLGFLRGGGDCEGRGRGRGGAFVFTTATADGDVAEGAALSPVTAAGFAKVSRLREAVVVVVAKFGVG